MILAGCLLFSCGAVLGQDASLTFEVASVKRVLNGMTVPGGGYRTEIKWIFPGSVVPGPPVITAKIPAGATKAQFNIMLQNLLKERFNLTLHRETKDLAVYELTVSKDGPKLQTAAAPDPEPSPAGPPQFLRRRRAHPDHGGYRRKIRGPRRPPHPG
jgi:hypothetical protein